MTYQLAFILKRAPFLANPDFSLRSMGVFEVQPAPDRERRPSIPSLNDPKTGYDPELSGIHVIIPFTTQTFPQNKANDPSLSWTTPPIFARLLPMLPNVCKCLQMNSAISTQTVFSKRSRSAKKATRRSSLENKAKKIKKNSRWPPFLPQRRYFHANDVVARSMSDPIRHAMSSKITGVGSLLHRSDKFCWSERWWQIPVLSGWGPLDRTNGNRWRVPRRGRT